MKFPDPDGLAGAAKNAIASGSSYVAFPVKDVIEMAGQVRAMLGLMRAMDETFIVLVPRVRRLLVVSAALDESAVDGDVDRATGLFAEFRAAMQEVRDALPEAAEAPAPGRNGNGPGIVGPDGRPA